MSADGRFVVFASENQNNLTQLVFLRDRLLSTTEIASVSTRNPEQQPLRAQSADLGRRPFHPLASDAPFVSTDNNGFDDLYVRDRLLGTIDRVSIGTDGTQSNDAFNSWADVPRRRYVAFWTSSSKLLGPADTSRATDIYVRDRLVNVTKRVSVAYNGAQSPSGSSSFSDGFAISGDGQTVAFDNTDPNLLPPGTDLNGKRDVFVRAVDGADPSGVDTLSSQQPAHRRRARGAGHRHEHAPHALPGDTGRGRGRHGRVPATGVGDRHGGVSGGSLNGDADVADTVVDLWPGSATR
jgi:hypothetical protein